MSPPGRRRASTPLFSALLCALLFFSNPASAISAVLGVDIGTEYIKAALVKPGIPLEIVLSKDSKRKEASAVAFKPLRGGALLEGSYPERSYGGDALALAARFPGDVYPNIKQLLGLPVDRSSVVKDYAARYPALEVVKSETRGTAAFKSKSFNREERPFGVEELLAMELMNVRENAQELAGKAHFVKSVVFTVPPFYTIEEKSALELAAELAGLKVLGVVTDGLAVGINYATSRTFEAVNEGGKPEYHMVFDVGAGYTAATVLKFQGRAVKDVGRFNKTIQEVSVLGTGWDRTLGGDALNTLIVKDMVTKFLETPGAKALKKSARDVLSHGRTSSKLWKDAERLRQVLSANSQAVSSFEDLYEDVDFKYKLSRTEFEGQTGDFAERLDAPFNSALKVANLTIADLDSIILHGGAVRTPFIQKRLETLAGDASKLRSNVNADEAAVFGAAFKAASISPSFRVKEIRGYDAAIYATWLQYPKNKDGKNQQQKIFTSASFTGSTKLVPFPKLDDFEFYLYQNRPTDKGSPFEAGSEGINGSKYTTKNLTESVAKLVDHFGCKREDVSTSFKIRLDPVYGLPEVVSGSVSCEHEVIDKKTGVVDDVKNFLGFGKKGDGSQQVLEDGDSSTSSSSTTQSSSTSSGAKSSETPAKGKKGTKAAKAAKEEDKPAVPKFKTEVINIVFETTYDLSTVIPWVEKQFIEERLKAFDASDRARRARETDLNNLEAFTYKSRDLIEDEGFTAFANEEQLTAIEKLVKATSAWLSEDGYGAASDILQSKLKDLKTVVDPIRKRKEEAAKRPELTKMLREALGQAQGLVNIIKDSMVVASSSEAAASSSASEEAAKAAASLSTSTSSADPETSVDPLAELEEDESSSTTSTTEIPTPSANPWISPYTEDDLKALTDTYESVNTWLEEKLAEQEKLKPYEDPIFAPGELQKKATELNDALMSLLQKKLKQQQPPKPKPKSKTSKTKAAPKPTKKPKAKTAKGEEKLKSVKDEINDKVKSATDKIKTGEKVEFEIKDGKVESKERDEL